MLLRCLLIAAVLPAILYADRLGKFLRNYDTLSYDSDELHLKHERARRSTGEDIKVQLDFSAHGRDFKLRLSPGSPHLSPNLIVETSEGAKHHQPDYLYVGKLEGEPNTECHGSILKGLFSGFIKTGDGTYYVEPAHRHFDVPTEFHSIIYKDSDVENPELGGCGLTRETMKWMQRVQKSAVPTEENHKKKRSADLNDQDGHLHSPRENPYTDPARRRTRRQTPANTCNLFLQADHTYTAYFNGEHPEVIAQFNNFVAAVNAIFNDISFGSYTNVGFMVDRIRINGTDEQSDTGNPFRTENIGVEKFLDLNSLQNHDAYCLAYIFANRDFNDGVLGLAWVGSPGSTAGGICQKSMTFSSGKQSLNTGIVTIKNYGSQVPTKVTEITFAHEIGHNFGSPHDDPVYCRATVEKDGKYVMYASATNGDRPNNRRFSTCSRNNMTRVIEAKASRCFVTSDRAVCGNQIVDEEEECDCGFSDQCRDNCCKARTSNGGAVDPLACQLVQRAGGLGKVACSPSQGACCNDDCYFKGFNSTICKMETECSMAATCNGISAKCPAPAHKEDQTPCNNYKQICKNGDCSGSICDMFNLRECYCSSSPTKEIKDTEFCHLCCQNGTDESTCRSTTTIKAMDAFTEMHGETIPGNTEKILYQIPGAPCNDLLGYCDVFYKCRDVDSNGPLSRLRDAILNPELYKNIAEWLKANWWAAVLMGLAVILFMAVFIKICSVHTPSSNPKLPKHRQLTLPRRSSARQRQAGRGIEMA